MSIIPNSALTDSEVSVQVFGAVLLSHPKVCEGSDEDFARPNDIVLACMSKLWNLFTV